MEVVVDAYDASERAMGWYAYLQDQLECPFVAQCVERRAISLLLVGDEVEVVSLAPADECAHEIFVMIRWEHGGLPVFRDRTGSSSTASTVVNRSMFMCDAKMPKPSSGFNPLRWHGIADSPHENSTRFGGQSFVGESTVIEARHEHCGQHGS
jgi:hypothetical protein